MREFFPCLAPCLTMSQKMKSSVSFGNLLMVHLDYFVKGETLKSCSVSRQKQQIVLDIERIGNRTQYSWRSSTVQP